MKRLLAAGAMTLLLAPMAAQAHAPGPGDAPSRDSSRVTWEQMRAAIEARLAVARTGQDRWELALNDETPADAGDTNSLDDVAVATVQAALKDIAWIVTEVMSRRYAVIGVIFKAGEKVQMPHNYATAFFKDPAFSDPVRRHADKALRSRGMTCDDCLEGLRPPRAVPWAQVREYLKGFIFVKEVAAEGRVDLRVGRVENALPEFSYCDQDVGSAAFAVMQTLPAQEPRFQDLVQQILNEELLNLGDVDPRTARERLNKRVPERVLKEPAALEMIGRWLPEALGRHGLTCSECPHGGAESGSEKSPAR